MAHLQRGQVHHWSLFLTLIAAVQQG